MLVGFLLYIPETPYCLIRKQRFEDAKKSLKWLRGTDDDATVEKEYQQICNDCTKEEGISRITYKVLFTKKQYLYPFLIVNTLAFVRQFCGYMYIVFLGKPIFERAAVDMDPGLSAFLIMLAKLFGTIFAIGMVEKIGRKPLLIMSTVAMSITCSTTATWFFMEENSILSQELNNPVESSTQLFDSELVETLSWIPLTSLMIYIFTFAGGIGPIAFLLNAELFPQEAKTLGCPLSHFLNWIFSFTVTVLMPSVKHYLHRSSVFFIFSGISFLGIFFCIIFVPETKGKTPTEIRKFFKKNKN